MKLDQSVFVGAPDWVEWVSTDFDGEAWFHEIKPSAPNDRIWIVAKGGRIKFAGVFDATNWQNSLIRRNAEEVSK